MLIDPEKRRAYDRKGEKGVTDYEQNKEAESTGGGDPFGGMFNQQ